MIEFIESPTYNNWLQKNIPSNSLIITTPFIKFSALKRLLHFYKTFDDFTLSELKILIRGNKDDFLQGSSDTASIDYLANLQENHPDKVQVRLLRNLHMKSYMIDHASLLITSGNLTHKGLMTRNGSGNVEGGIASNDQEVLNKFSAYFNSIFESGTDISTFVNSSTYNGIKAKLITHSPSLSPSTSDREINAFTIPQPKKLLEYPETEREDSNYKRFKLVNPIDPDTLNDNLRDFIPQHAVSDNYLKTLTFIHEHSDEDISIDALAYHLGSTALQKRERYRKPSGVLKNLRLLGLIEDRPCENELVVQRLTELGNTFIQLSTDEQAHILKIQSAKLPWMEHIRSLRSANPTAEITQILTEYLCSYPLNYAETTSDRYRAPMRYFCELNGIV